jgi:Cof subfamily protein (haloacid dehalogenase superfamily)
LGLKGGEDYIIAFNGGLVVSADQEEVLCVQSFLAEEISRLLSYGDSIGALTFMYLRDGLLSNRDHAGYRSKNPDVRYEVVDLKTVDWAENPVFKIAYVNDPDRTKEVRAALPPELVSDFEISSSVPQFVDFVSKGISKARALAAIGDRVGVSADEMVAFGDEDNDLPMMNLVGLPIAMGNASPAVKEAAAIVTRSNDEEGVAIAIRRNVLGDSE